jgi:hypothetical protein
MRRIFLFLLLSACCPPADAHSIPGCANSTTPACVTLVGAFGSVPAADAGQFTVIVRDCANNPVSGAVVVIDLSACADLHLCADQLDPSATVDCAQKRVTKIAAADGSVSFTLLGGSNGPGNASTLLGGGRIYANGTLIRSPTVAAFDLDGVGLFGAADLSAWLTDFGSGLPYGRSDYDCDGAVGAGDLSVWLTVFSAGSFRSCTSKCP